MTLMETPNAGDLQDQKGIAKAAENNVPRMQAAYMAPRFRVAMKIAKTETSNTTTGTGETRFGIQGH